MTYFKTEEFACKCGCGRDVMQTSTLTKLIAARHAANIPFTITSGVRCEEYNKKVGGKSNGAHTTGHAVDIAASVSPNRYLIVKALLDAGFTRIGIGKGFIHADDDPSKPPNVMWEYT